MWKARAQQGLGTLLNSLSISGRVEFISWDHVNQKEAVESERSGQSESVKIYSRTIQMAVPAGQTSAGIAGLRQRPPKHAHQFLY